jgi:hypothetical protein
MMKDSQFGASGSVRTAEHTRFAPISVKAKSTRVSQTEFKYDYFSQERRAQLRFIELNRYL